MIRKGQSELNCFYENMNKLNCLLKIVLRNGRRQTNLANFAIIIL